MALSTTVLMAMLLLQPAHAQQPARGRHGGPWSHEPRTSLLVTGLQGGSGSTLGPGGALYVTEPGAGRVLRVDPQTGDVTTFASGLPTPLPTVGIGGAMDVAFIGHTAYVLVTLVGPDVGGSDEVGIYRVDGPGSFTFVADIGTFAINHPPDTAFFVPSGVQYAMEAFRGGFLVTDGHHNRVLRVTLDGNISVVKAFDNIVPTGLALHGNTVYMAEAGPTPHNPEDGKVVAFRLPSWGRGFGFASPFADHVPWAADEHSFPGVPGDHEARVVASGARLLVDVEFGRGDRLYALSQGVWDGVTAGSPALPDTGSLVEANGDGTFSVVVTNVDRPTSMEFVGTTAYIVTLDGEIWRIDDVSSPPFGRSR